jgi:transmembrane 9 superfamily protein 2/4
MYLSLPIAMLLGGFLPFGAIFVELFYILSSVWSNKVFYLFGFLLVVSVFLIVTNSLMSVILTYLQLCSEDYSWWWRSFLISGSTGIYVFCYGLFYYSTRLNIEAGSSSVMYFGYTFILSLFIFLMTGSIGFLASFLFVKNMYNSIKID